MFTRWLFSAFLIVSCSAAMALGPLPFEELTYRGIARPYYGNAGNPNHVQMLDLLRRTNSAERLAQFATSALRLKRDIAVVFDSCGRPNAFFDPQKSAVVLCLELVELIAFQAKNDLDGVVKDRNSFSRVFEGALWGIYLHELAHAMISINSIPITGREEDVADQFALFYSVNYIEPRNIAVVFPTIWFFKQLARNADISSSNQDSIKILMADEHSLSEQRIYNLACWAYGVDPSRGQEVIRYVQLPDSRKERCPQEYASMSYGFQKLFQRYLKPQK